MRAFARIALAVVLAIASVVAALVLFASEPVPVGRGGFAFVRPAPGTQATLWAVGDGDASAAGRRVVDRIRADRVDRLLYLGDVYEQGTAAEFRDSYAPSYGRLAPHTAPTPGNHDWGNHESGYDPYWRRALRRHRTAAWYAFRAARWEILGLNSEARHERGSPQERWLRARLRRATGTCRIAFWHRARFSAGTKHGDHGDVAPLWDALIGHAAIVVAAHEHNMQRLRRIDGIASFVSGAGGRGHYDLDAGDERLAFGDDRSYGALRLRLRRGAAAFAFVSAGGRVLDDGTIRCRPLAARTRR